VFLLKAQTNSVVNGYYIKAIKAIVLQNDTIQLKNPVNGQILGRVNGKWININKPNDLDTLATNELQTLQEVTDLGNTVNKTTTALSDSTYYWRTWINQTSGSSTNKMYGFKNYTTYSGSQSQWVVGGIVSFVNNTGTGLVSSIGGMPVVVNTANGTQATNIWGVPVNIYNRGKFNKLMGLYSWIENYNYDAANNDTYGVVNTFKNYGFLDGYSGFQADIYNYGKVNDLDGLLIGMYLTDSVGNAYGIRLGGGAHKWTGQSTNSYGIYADRSIDRGTTNSYFVYSESRSPLRHFGNFQLDTLRGSGDRIVIADIDGKFKATKKDSTYYWNSAYGDILTSGSVTGTSTKTITLFQRDGGSFSFNFSDISGGSGGGGSALYEGIVTDRNIDVTIADYTPSDYDIIEVKPDTEIETGDTITLSINGGAQEDIYGETDYDIDYRLKLMYYDGRWFIMDKIGSGASLKGKVDATNLIINTKGIEYIGLA